MQKRVTLPPSSSKAAENFPVKYLKDGEVMQKNFMKLKGLMQPPKAYLP